MKQFIYIFCLFTILEGSSCNRKKGENHPRLHQEEQSYSDSLSETISLDELPVLIKEEINNHELFYGLNISNIVRITENDFTYYDMTFKDIDGQLIMVFYDEEGKIIVP
ncbi:MAG: hypothetical protein WD426_01830 [Anditalea sp.]